jgi:hypothetical protein
MRNKKSRGLFDDQFRLEKISKLKDPLEKLNIKYLIGLAFLVSLALTSVIQYQMPRLSGISVNNWRTMPFLIGYLNFSVIKSPKLIWSLMTVLLLMPVSLKFPSSVTPVMKMVSWKRKRYQKTGKRTRANSASVHDSDALEDLLNETDAGKLFHGDSAYTGKRCAKVIRKFKMKNLTHKKGYRNKPLSKYLRKKNHQKSKIRARVEHVFGFIWQNLNGSSFFRYIGIDRNASSIGLQNIVYNLFRAVYLIEARRMSIKL